MVWETDTDVSLADSPIVGCQRYFSSDQSVWVGMPGTRSWIGLSYNYNTNYNVCVILLETRVGTANNLFNPYVPADRRNRSIGTP